MSSDGIGSVDALTSSLRKLLERARELKPNGGIEPALTSTSFDGEVGTITKRAEGGITAKVQGHYAALETACRNIFYDLLVRSKQQSGVIDVADKSEKKHFKQKQLIILRACNELLRRLSRAEDTVFCGRVFIFMFQSFPLGDRSSVNLRGEYHVENVTVFEKPATKQSSPEEGFDGAMEVDQAPDVAEKEKAVSGDAPVTARIEGDRVTPQPTENTAKTVKFDSQEDKPQKPEPDTESLYPIFWSLQDVFSQPTRLFDTSTFKSFKSGLDLTLRKFKAVQQHQQSRGTSKLPSESHRPFKRKRAGTESDEQYLAGSFNPRYLTSRDLFDLEISDLAFRRHILVQALILVNFLLSLTPEAKKKLETASNKSVLYNYTLPEDEVKWVTAMRTEIASYLQQGQEGKFYFRMVDTVLSRDKNWVHWKAEGCPLIKQPPIASKSFIESQKGAQKTSAPKRIRPTPMGSLDLSFLLNTGDEGQAHGLEVLKEPARYTLPKVGDFKGPIMEDEFDMEMAKTDAERETVAVAKASKTWRALRIASKNRLNIFDKLEDGNRLGPLFDPPPTPEKGDRNSLGQTDGVGEKDRIEGEAVANEQNTEVNGVKEIDPPEATPKPAEAT
ncbi:MAG: hypothetical protein Q9166_004375 [cf. Caloplaca sp. 2 TL-2023]